MRITLPSRKFPAWTKPIKTVPESYHYPGSRKVEESIYLFIYLIFIPLVWSWNGSHLKREEKKKRDG